MKTYPHVVPVGKIYVDYRGRQRGAGQMAEMTKKEHDKITRREKKENKDG